MTLFLVQADYVVWIQARPLAPDQTDVRMTTLVPAHGPDADKPDSYWQMNHQITSTTLTEDFLLGESI